MGNQGRGFEQGGEAPQPAPTLAVGNMDQNNQVGGKGVVRRA